MEKACQNNELSCVIDIDGFDEFLNLIYQNYEHKNPIYDDFKKAFKEVSGCEWVDVRGEYAYRKDEFVKALMQVKNISEQSARDLIKDSKTDYSISPDRFAQLIKDYLDSKGPKNRIIFLVDEIGQFISDNTNNTLKCRYIN